VNVRSLEWVESVLAAADGLLVAASLDDDVRSLRWDGAVIDSRLECSGRVFFAIAGERSDGHDFVKKAYAAGAVAAVVENEASARKLDEAKIPYLRVNSTVTALQELARAYRDRLDARVVAITGSAGKTTTKEYVRAVMRTRYRVHSNPGNYNSMIGVPVTVLQAEPDCEYLVSEVGANQAGEIDFLAGLLRPDVGVITNIGDAHVGEFGSRDAIARAKGELLDHIPAAGTAVLPHDDDYIDALRERARCRVLTFGGPGADYALSDVVAEPGQLRFTVNGKAVAVRALGSYNAANACAAFAVGEICGVEPERIGEAFAGVLPMPGRGRVIEQSGVTLVDESYNASPASMILSLSMLAELPGRSRRVAVLGEMKELGDEAPANHERIGRHAGAVGVDVLWWVGGLADRVRAGIEAEAARVAFRAFADVEAAIAASRGLLGDGDAVLVKASRACELDRFVSHCLEMLAQGEGA
jgi:UDP-N-acetylmuramoyl-tripeptide--D-alanyl-D-alanine ligase